MLKIANQTMVFLIELVMLGAFSYFGLQKGNGLFAKYALAITLPVVAIILWSYLAAPKSTHRLTMPYLAIFRLSLFLLASYLLYKCSYTKSALTLAILAMTTQVLSLILESNDQSGN